MVNGESVKIAGQFRRVFFKSFSVAVFALFEGVETYVCFQVNVVVGGEVFYGPAVAEAGECVAAAVHIELLIYLLLKKVVDDDGFQFAEGDALAVLHYLGTWYQHLDAVSKVIVFQRSVVIVFFGVVLYFFFLEEGVHHGAH